MPTAFFLVPYERIDEPRRIRRRVAVDAATPRIHADGGEWGEMEVAGDQAVVRVRASAGTLKDLAWAWPRLREVGSHLRSPHKTIDSLFREVADEQLHGERWRLAESLTRLADREGYVRLTGLPWAEAARVLGLCSRFGYGLDRVSTGTFPTTSLLDNFNRSDETPLANSTWGLNPYGSGNECRILSNVVTSQGTGINQFGNSYWSAATFGADVEVYFEMTVSPNSGNNQQIGMHFRLANIGASVDGYEVFWKSGLNEFSVWRIDNGTETQLGAVISGTMTANDWLGAEMIGSTITVYFKDGASAWANQGTRSDATYSAPGNIGCAVSDTTARIDNFSGGTVVAGGQPSAKRMGGVQFNAGPFGRLQGARGW